MDEKFAEKQRTVAEGVMQVLEIDPHIGAGPDYAKLVLLFWTYVDEVFTYNDDSGYYYTTEEDFRKATSSESITRAFRKLLEELFPINTLPLTTNFSAGLVVPIPTFPSSL